LLDEVHEGPVMTSTSVPKVDATRGLRLLKTVVFRGGQVN
jgi:hypothetical protein